jgi:microcystin-dependent protein
VPNIDQLSPLLNLILMGDGLHFNTWGDQLNADLTIVENAIAGNSVIPVTGPAMTLSIPQTNGAILTFTGTLVANTVITLAPVPGKWIVSNQTFGAFSLSLQAGASIPTVVPPAPQTHLFYTDGQNVFDASQSTAAIAAAIAAANAAYLPPGAIQEFAMNAAPGGWLECNGATALRLGIPPAGDSQLFAAIGTTWGVGDGSTTFNVPDFRGSFRRGWDHGKGVDAGRTFASFQADMFKAHTHVQNAHAHTITDPGHTHTVGPSSVTVGATAGGVQVEQPGGGVTGTGTTGIAATDVQTSTEQSAGGTETAPKNYATLVCIRR